MKKYDIFSAQTLYAMNNNNMLMTKNKILNINKKQLSKTILKMEQKQYYILILGLY
jgi:hypothetical protein